MRSYRRASRHGNGAAGGCKKFATYRAGAFTLLEICTLDNSLPPDDLASGPLIDPLGQGWTVYFADLTLYQYGRAEPEENVFNIGWLSATQDFSRGPSDERFIAALQQLIAAPVKLHRGIHLCEFCPPPPKTLAPNGLWQIHPLPGTAGNGQIRVTGKTGAIFAAPVLILHYVLAHGYRPPQEFIDAVIAAAAVD